MHTHKFLDAHSACGDDEGKPCGRYHRRLWISKNRLFHLLGARISAQERGDETRSSSLDLHKPQHEHDDWCGSRI